jgi:uncharacterized membrane protein YfcA
MTWWQAGLWGLIGGGAASVLSFTTAIVSSGYTWPWRKKDEDVGPRLFVLAAGAVLGAAVAAAAHDQISGPWPAFIFGIGAPATIKGLLSGVEVSPRTLPGTTADVRKDTALPASSVIEEGGAREDAP